MSFFLNNGPSFLATLRPRASNMFFNKITVAALATAAAAAQAASSAIDADVVVVGGGTSGAYAAVRLSQDFGKKVLVVEKESVLVRACDQTANIDDLWRGN